MKVKSYKDLSVWQKAMELGVECYRVTDAFPRSAISIPSNVAEGDVRLPSNEYCHYLAIALGSTAGRETQIELARMLDLESGGCITAHRASQEVGRILNELTFKSLLRFDTVLSGKSPRAEPGRRIQVGG